MSILSSLVRAYDRLPDAPPFGYSMEKIGFVISLNADGGVASVTDLRSGEGKKKQPWMMLVPQPVKRTAGIAPNFLWDKTSYVLGVTAGEGKRTADEHAAFVQRHVEALQGSEDEGLRALLFFLQSWQPARFSELGWSEEMKDQNVVFALESERRRNLYLHDRSAAKEAWRVVSGQGERQSQICLVTGIPGEVARLHPSIKGVFGAQSSGAALVSFNLEAFTSYGHEQGDNAPVSEAAAFAYTTALNEFLKRDSRHKIQMGETTIVFWADAASTEAAEIAENYISAMIGAPSFHEEEKAAAKEIRIKLERIRKGELFRDIEPKLDEHIRFYLLGLSPNAARLSVRYYFEDDFGTLTKNYLAYVQDMEFEPWPKGREKPTIFTCCLRTAPAREDRNGRITFDKEQVSPLLSGELLRAILSGARFPGSLLGLLLTRIRGDHLIDSTRAALIKAILVRDMRFDKRLPKRPDGTFMEDYLVRTDPNDPNEARRMGRLFAVLERTQLAALGDEINATIKDKFFSAAAATPRQVFPDLLKLSEHHLQRLRNGHTDADWIINRAEKLGIPVARQAKRVGASLANDIGKLAAGFQQGFPAQHDKDEQGFFLVGYYQERFGGRADPESGDQPNIDTESTKGEE